MAVLPYPATNAFTSASLNSAGLATISKTGKTQLKVSFATDDDGDSTADTISLATGNHGTSANRPTLEISYIP